MAATSMSTVEITAGELATLNFQPCLAMIEEFLTTLPQFDLGTTAPRHWARTFPEDMSDQRVADNFMDSVEDYIERGYAVEFTRGGFHIDGEGKKVLFFQFRGGPADRYPSLTPIDFCAAPHERKQRVPLIERFLIPYAGG